MKNRPGRSAGRFADSARVLQIGHFSRVVSPRRVQDRIWSDSRPARDSPGVERRLCALACSFIKPWPTRTLRRGPSENVHENHPLSSIFLFGNKRIHTHTYTHTHIHTRARLITRSAATAWPGREVLSTDRAANAWIACRSRGRESQTVDEGRTFPEAGELLRRRRRRRRTDD